MTTARPEPLLGDYYRSIEGDTAQDAADRKLIQAEALAHLLYGERGETLRMLSDDLQDNICFLLSDLIGEYRLFRHKAKQEAAGKPTAHAVAEELHNSCERAERTARPDGCRRAGGAGMNKRKLPESKVPEQELFSFGGRYLVARETTSDLLLDDADCWMAAANEIVNVLAIELNDKGSDLAANPQSAARMLWGVFHLLEMAQGAITTAQLRSEAKP